MQPNEDIVGKSPTTLLIGGSTGDDRMFKPSSTAAEAFGRDAQRRYAENDIPQGAQLFKRFKMVRETHGYTERHLRASERREDESVFFHLFGGVRDCCTIRRLAQLNPNDKVKPKFRFLSILPGVVVT